MALGYVLQPPQPGYLVRSGAAAGKEQYTAIVDPAGVGPRLLFQRVPEPKTLKNRVHLDVNAGHGRPIGAPRCARTWPSSWRLAPPCTAR